MKKPLIVVGALLALVAWELSSIRDPRALKPAIALMHSVQWVDATTLQSWMNEPSPPIIYDVRERQEYELSHLRSARWLQPGTSPPPLPHARVVFYCSVGARSAEMTEAAGAGFNLEGGIFAWANSGRMLFGRDPERVHPFSPSWSRFLRPSLLPATYAELQR